MKLFRLTTKRWFIERAIYLIAGVFVSGSVALGFLVTPAFFLFTALVGLMQIIFALTGYCPMAILLNIWGLQEK